VSREVLSGRLRRHRRLFHEQQPASRRPPGTLALLWHELRARHGADLLWAPLLWLPLVGPRIRAWLAADAVCAFAAFRDEAERQVGCLLHPIRWEGRDVRPRAAFRLLRGLGCGAPDYACSGAARFSRADKASRGRFLDETRSLDWFTYSAAAPAFTADHHDVSTTDTRSTPCPSSSTRPSR
jgi:hypothetical protein